MQSRRTEGEPLIQRNFMRVLHFVFCGNLHSSTNSTINIILHMHNGCFAVYRAHT